MIYKVTWMDGRQLVLRANDEEQARTRAADWRQYDPMFDADVPWDVFAIEHVTTRGQLGPILAGWTPEAHAAQSAPDAARM